jgi:hypothetical protein
MLLERARRTVAATATIVAVAGLGLSGSAPKASASSTTPCRAWTAPGFYPSGVQLRPCNGVTMGNYSDIFGYATSPQTDVRVWLQVGWKPWYLTGEPTSFDPPVNGGIISPTTSSYVPQNFQDPTHLGAAGYCYYTRMWYTNGTYTSSWVESPSTCF